MPAQCAAMDIRSNNPKNVQAYVNEQQRIEGAKQYAATHTWGKVTADFFTKDYQVCGRFEDAMHDMWTVGACRHMSTHTGPGTTTHPCWHACSVCAALQDS